MSEQSPSVRPRPARGRPSRSRRRVRLALPAAVLVAVIVVIVLVTSGASLPRPPPPGLASAPGNGDPFGYRASRAADFTARATAGNANVLFAKSPGGAQATAARVAAYRPEIDRAVAGTGIDPALLEGLVFVESAGRPDAIAGADPANAAGLTQIVASTGQSLLGMRIDLARSRRLTARIDAGGISAARLRTLLAQRAAADPRFDPVKALAASVRYLKDAESQFGRQDLAFESYHMGIGNLHDVLVDYDGGGSVPYVQLYFDSAPNHHPAAYRLLSGFGDDSWLYWWRILGAEQIMRSYRTDRAALTRLAVLQGAGDSGASVLHPPGRPPRFSDPAALAAAYQRRAVVPLPRNAAALGLAYDGGMGAGAARVGAPRALYQGLSPVALRLLIELAGRVRTLAGGRGVLHVATTVSDARYQSRTGVADPPATTGYAFAIDRRYFGPPQANAFQAMLDRLQSLNLIAWARQATTITVTVASDAAAWRS